MVSLPAGLGWLGALAMWLCPRVALGQLWQAHGLVVAVLSGLMRAVFGLLWLAHGVVAVFGLMRAGVSLAQ
jgi:hypothetical protein